MQTIPQNYLRQLGMLLALFALGGVICWQLAVFIPAFLGAYTLYVLLRKAMFVLTGRYRWRRTVAAGVLMLLSFIVILLPIDGLVQVLYAKIIPSIQQSHDVWTSFEQLVRRVEQQYGINLLTEENFRNLGDWGMRELQKVLGATFNGVMAVAVMYFVLYFLLVEGPDMERTLLEWLPLHKPSVVFLKQHLNGLVFSNAVGIPLVAMLQGVVAWIGYWLTGVPDTFVWFVATCIAAVIPLLGAMIVYVPLAALLLANGHMTQGIVLFLYGFLIVGSVDNLFRFWLQKRIGDTHPLITVFGVVIGLNLFGFIGLVFGPILISLFLLLLQVYAREFGGGPRPITGDGSGGSREEG